MNNLSMSYDLSPTDTKTDIIVFSDLPLFFDVYTC